MVDLFIFPDKSLNQKVFNIRSPEVVDALGLDYTNNFHRYSYNDIYPGIENQLPLISSIFDKKEDERDMFEAQLLEIYQNVMRYRQIASSFSCLLPMFTVYDSETAEKLHIQPGQFASYAHIMIMISLDISQSPFQPEQQWSEFIMRSTAFVNLQQIMMSMCSKIIPIRAILLVWIYLGSY